MIVYYYYNYNINIFINRVRPESIEVRAGSTSSREGGIVAKVSDIISHEGFSVSNLDNDVALLQLAEPLEFTDSVKAIPLTDEEVELEDGCVTTVTGWGYLKVSTFFSYIY